MSTISLLDVLMKVTLLSNEFPPLIYGGAGVHIDNLSRELSLLTPVNVHCFGEQNEETPDLKVRGVTAHLDEGLYKDHAHKGLFETLDKNISMSSFGEPTNIVHCHTWYTHLSGIMVKNLQQVPLILTTHSLEPHRPWKVEQLGSGYHMSCWIEKTAYQNADGIIAVSNDMKKDVIEAYGVDESKVKVIYNGIDPDFYQPTFDDELLNELGIDPAKPFVLFVGRVTRQKGIAHLLQAAKKFEKGTQVVLCAGAPDSEVIAKECNDLLVELQAEREGVIWISEMLPHEKLKVLYTMASVFICPSLYEPFGIINLEAMACGTPVVGSAVGGIPEIILNENTGYLVPFEARSKMDFEPVEAHKFHNDLAKKVNLLLNDEALCKHMGETARKRVEAIFSWKSIAHQTLGFYQEVLERYNKEKKDA